MSCDNNDDDEGLELLQRARLLVQAATNLPDFSTLFKKQPASPHDDNPSAAATALPSKTTQAPSTTIDNMPIHTHNTYGAESTPLGADLVMRTRRGLAPKRPPFKPSATQQNQEESTPHEPCKQATQASPSNASGPKKAKKAKPKTDASNDGSDVDDADRRAAQALAQKYAQERAAARVAAKLREQMAAAEKEAQSQAACVHEFYETLEEKEHRLKIDRSRAKDRIVKAKQAKEELDAKHADGAEPAHAGPEQLEKFQKQTKERLLKAKEAKRQAELLRQAQERQQEEMKAKHLADEAASADDAKRRADQVRRETKRRLKAIQAHKDKLERMELELRQQGLDKYKHHKDEMEWVAKGGAPFASPSVSKHASKTNQSPAALVHTPDSSVNTGDSPAHVDDAPATLRRPSENDTTIELSHGELEEEIARKGVENTIVIVAADDNDGVGRQGKVDLPPLVVQFAEPAADPLKRVVKKKALWKRPPVPIPTVDEIAHRSKHAMPAVAPAIPSRHVSYTDRMKSRSAPSSLNSQAERLVSATRERAKQMDKASSAHG
ncbi:hypothetical protein H310_05195 [Aphanomyces invadans]|uniref:Uncharacterized protein n=1 Tax=Aphanomyces invadans TaxID=157072 RepID=A0A024UC41_9STRA|nr:hypothetical protein H310_05195 [Aphanomyces invadans]ETW03839.1 hypothetical protein H310_05195 [Aphanomyces invadans]|eukprot:XP_008868068.1 hypothetical protein H310_05195 [Aphanomyces invadans]